MIFFAAEGHTKATRKQLVEPVGQFEHINNIEESNIRQLCVVAIVLQLPRYLPSVPLRVRTKPIMSS